MKGTAPRVAQSAQQASGGKDEKVVDADFEVVDDKDK